MTYRICVVCSGNICRSPMGAVILAHLVADAGLTDAIEVESGGMGHWHVGDQADARARATLTAAGYDGEAHRAAQVERDWFDRFDLLLAADNTHVRGLKTLAPSPEDAAKVRLIREFDPAAVRAETLEVNDPYYGDAADFEECLRVLEPACRGVLEFARGEIGR